MLINNHRFCKKMALAAGLLAAGSLQAAVVYFTGASGVDNNFSTVANWSAFPAVSGDTPQIAVTNINGIATSASNPAKVNAGWTNTFGTARIYSQTGYGQGMAYAEVMSGGLLKASILEVGNSGNVAFDGTLTLRSGGSIDTLANNTGSFKIGGETSGMVGDMVVEAGAALFREPSLNLFTYGTLTFVCNSNSLSTLNTVRTTAGSSNLLNGLIQVDLSALTTAGTYTLVNSSSTNLLIAGSMRTWLDSVGGSYSNSGDFANANFQVIGGNGKQWTLALADGNQDLTLTVIPVYTLTVNSGTGSGSYASGQQVAIAASNLTSKAFVQWTGDTPYVNNVTYTNALVTMSTNVTLTATYKPVYLLTVNDGTGGGWYTNGQQVAIVANVRPGAFIAWTGDTQYVNNVTYTNALVTMSTNPVTLTSTYVTFPMISYWTNSIAEATNLFGGVANGRYEPGETIDITVFSTNNGSLDVSNVVNSLSADPVHFTISNLNSQYYPVVAVGAVTSTTYQVTILSAATNGAYWFSVTNRAGTNVWADSFLLNVFKQSLPSVSPASITMSILTGAAVTNTQVTVTNAGNTAFTFNIIDNAFWGSFYNVTTGTLGKTAFVANYNNVVVLNDPDIKSVPISSTNAGVSAAISLGFDFPFYGATYSNFYVTADGYIGLGTNVPVRSTDRSKLLPDTNVAEQIIAPFWGILNSPADSIRYARNFECLAIAFSGVSKESGGTNLQFQVALFTNGCIELRYATIAGVTNNYGQTNVTIGFQGNANRYTNLAVNPANGTSVRLTPQPDRWVSYTPAQNVTVEPQSSQVITFIANASGKTAATGTTFKSWFNWSNGGSNAVFVSANVAVAAPVYSAVSSLSFTGTAGQVTAVPFIITNAGSAPLTFSISDTAAKVAGYTTTNSAAYSWIDISSIGTNIDLIDPDPSPHITAADEGYSARIPIKFAFPFYGVSYTQFCVSVNGALRLDTTGRVGALVNLAYDSSSMPVQMIAPYWGDLVMDGNATLKYHSATNQLVITWENVRQYGFNGGSNQTFQAILKPSGDITFQYKKLEGGISWPNTTIGLRDTTNRTVRADIRRTDDRMVTTNQYGRVSTQYVNAVSNRIVQFQSAQIQTIRYAPDHDSIPAGGTKEITIIGDASNQQAGTNNISTNTMLTITHNESNSPASLAVTFTVTNSFEAAFGRASALADGSIDSDGDGVSDDQERIAGTDPQNADSVFTPTIGRDSSGTYLLWPAPLDGVQRNYTLYFTTNLMSLWEYLYTVTNGTTYLDTKHGNVPAIYYKITVPVQ
jgi:hypothetical protein